MPHKDPATGKGNHIHVILDNQPYEAYYEINQPFELRNVTEGKHTLRVFPSRPWHESFKNEGAFQMVDFTVKGGGDASKPTTTKDGQTMASPTKSPAARASATPAREGKDFAPSKGGDVDPAKPLLTYSRPKGEYKGEDADPIMIDFWLSNAKLQGDGGTFRVRYSIDGGEAKFIDKWEPIWLSGWINGKHQVKLELVDKDGNLVDNGGYNSTTRRNHRHPLNRLFGVGDRSPHSKLILLRFRFQLDQNYFGRFVSGIFGQMSFGRREPHRTCLAISLL